MTVALVPNHLPKKSIASRVAIMVREEKRMPGIIANLPMRKRKGKNLGNIKSQSVIPATVVKGHLVGKSPFRVGSPRMRATEKLIRRKKGTNLATVLKGLNAIWKNRCMTAMNL